MIIRDLYYSTEPLRFNQLLRSLKPISSKTLSAKLKELQKLEIVKREAVSITPVVIHYSLTEKGKRLTEVMDAMAKWSLKWNMDVP